MPQLGDGIEVVFALGFFHGDTGVIEFFTQGANLVNRALFVVPLHTKDTRLFTHIRELFREELQARLGSVILLVFQRGLFDFKSKRAPRQCVEFLRHTVHLGTNHCAGFVDQIDCFIG